MKWLHITSEIKIMVFYGLGHLDKWKNRDKSYAKHELPAKPRGELIE